MQNIWITRFASLGLRPRSVCYKETPSEEQECTHPSRDTNENPSDSEREEKHHLWATISKKELSLLNEIIFDSALHCIKAELDGETHD